MKQHKKSIKKAVVVKLKSVEVIDTMAKQKGMNNAGTNAQEVKAQNQASTQGQSSASASQGQFQAEFGSETNAQQVRQKNQKSQAKKGSNQQ